MRFWFGFLVGVACALLLVYRRQLSDLWHNRGAISAGQKAVGGAQQAVEGIRDLFKELN